MNKEQFKISMIRQFRNRDSAIRNLMLPEFRQTMNTGGKDIFAKRKLLYATEFGMMLYVRHFPDKEDAPVFELQFEELPPEFKLTPTMQLRNLSANEFKNIVYRIEQVHYNNKYIHFTVGSFTLTHDNYVFRKVYPQRTFLLSYEVASNSHSRMDVNEALAEIAAMRVYPSNDIYVEYEFNESERQRLMAYLKGRLAASTLEEYVEAFDNPRVGRATTNLGRIIETLAKFPYKP